MCDYVYELQQYHEHCVHFLICFIIIVVVAVDFCFFELLIIAMQWQKWSHYDKNNSAFQ